ncbi:hypothetical protein BaRGS_00029104 [Batillaria attramentaria]|uniref:Uncharacterized protein n=1 Tax=Batillaria attramentaria TaxID=370345 RepID=A0ABD0JYN1_9CAEN
MRGGPTRKQGYQMSLCCGRVYAFGGGNPHRTEPEQTHAFSVNVLSRALFSFGLYQCSCCWNFCLRKLEFPEFPAFTQDKSYTHHYNPAAQQKDTHSSSTAPKPWLFLG